MSRKQYLEKKRKNFIKIVTSTVFVLILVISAFVYNEINEADVVGAGSWPEGKTDSTNYEVLQVENESDTSTVAAPSFSINTVKSDYGNNSTVTIAQSGKDAIVNGIGRFQVGDSFNITATRANFISKNIKFSSSDTSVLSVAAAGVGSCKVTVVGPGFGTINWTYTYQRYYLEETHAKIINASGEEVEDPNITWVMHVQPLNQSVITGDITANINPSILNQTEFMKPNDTLYLPTNIPITTPASNVSPTYTGGNGMVQSLTTDTTKGSNYYLVLTSKNVNQNATINVKVDLVSNKGTLSSEVAKVYVVDTYGLFPSAAEFNCVDYEKYTDYEYQAVNHEETLTVSSSSENTVEWTYVDENTGTSIPITSGGEVALRTGLTAKLNGNKSVVLTTDSTFFDGLESSKSYTFKIHTEQYDSSKGTTNKDDATITVTRPVMGIEVHQSGTGYLINSRQEMYTEIGYTTNGNDVTIPKAKEIFSADTDVLTAYVAALGDAADGTIMGTNGETVTDAFSFGYTPYNSKVKWSSSNEDVIAINNIQQGTNYSTCNIAAVGAGEATIQAVAEDGSFIQTIHYIVRPYPRTITMKDTTLSERLGESTSKQVTLLAKATTDLDAYDEDTPAEDEFLSQHLLWEINSGGSIGSVDQNGIVTFTGPGTIVVRATSLVDHNGFQAYAPWAQCTITVEQPVESITITNKPTEPLTTGDVIALKTKILPTNATDQSVIWTSANESIVKVSGDGKVTAVGPGTTTVRVQTNSGAKYDSCTIEVKQVASGVALNRTEATVSRGNKLTLIATVYPEDTTDKTVTWTSSDKNIAKVSNKGVVTGVAVSSLPVIITATDVYGNSAVCYITVTEPVTGIKISPKKKTVYVGNDFKIKATLYPLYNSSLNQTIYWKTSNKKVATVDANGNVSPLAGGKATITATAEDGGYIAKCKVTVKEYVTSITLDYSSLNMEVGDSAKLKATVKRTTATNRNVVWKTSNKKIVSVTQKGKLKANAVGSCKITVKAKDGSGVKAVCKIKVVRLCTKIKVDKTFVTIITGNQYKLPSVTVYPKTATNKKLKWTSMDKSIVSVNGSKMFAEQAGTTYLKVKTTDGSKLTKKVRVKVIDPVPVTSLTITQDAITMTVGKSNQLEVRVLPTDTTSSVMWMTDDRSVATVSSTGLVKSIGPGQTTITAYCKDEGMESQCVVTVIEMNPQSIAIEQYDTYTLSVTGVGEDGTVTWTSSNANVVTVNNTGKIMGVKPGSAVITGTYDGKSVRCYVTVKSIV
ncbi:MAG: Ig-like domain-containing protein [Lachnospiraceae bacterium]|nr:Ig-like domain-containing protein [Lachnospiraceae bacterium]